MSKKLISEVSRIHELIGNKESAKFTSVLKSIITEQSKYEILLNKLTKSSKNKKGEVIKPKLTKDEFYKLVQADPTTNLNNVNLSTASQEELADVKAGKYVPWIIKHYLQPKTERAYGEPGYEQEVKVMKDRFMEDLYKITDDLAKFHKFKNRIQGEKDLNKLTPEDLYDKVKDFSLEKKKASDSEKKEAAKSFKHPGGEIAFKGKNWTVAKITDPGELGRDAACFYGGYHLEPSKKETRWCTSSPGLPQWFYKHIKQGPLYVILPNNWSGEVGEKSGLPAERYQFHFQSNQYMDPADRPIDLIKFLSENEELKDFFKPEFAKGLVDNSGEVLTIDGLSKGSVGKYISLYGLEDLFKNLPKSLKEISIRNTENKDIIIQIPESISEFKDLEMIMFENVIDKLPDSICQLNKLSFLVLLDNKSLTTLPACIPDIENLMFVNTQGCTNLKVPESFTEKGRQIMDGGFDFANID